MRNLIEFEYSPWLIIVCLLAGGAYGYLQYTLKTPWSTQVNLTLALIRGVLVSLVAILLLGPLIRAVRNYYEDPVLVMVLDSSESVGLNLDSSNTARLIKELEEIAEEMREVGWQVEVVNLSGNDVVLDSLSFTATRTDLTRLIRSQLSNYSGANLGALLVVTDGIFNAGFSPDLITPFTPIYTLGIGDTVPRTDVSIIDLEYNKTVYQDNRYPISIKLRNEGIQSGSANLRIYDAGRLVGRELLKFSPEARILAHEFLLDANTSGKHRISIVLDSVPGEATTLNNRQQIYVDVIDGKQKILIAAEAPSPEIKAFRSALSDNERFEISQSIGNPPASFDYDLIVLFNSPTTKSRRVFEAVAAVDVPKLYYIGSSTDLRPYLNQGIIGFNRITRQYDQVRATINTELTAFNMTNDLESWLVKVPPMTVPYGDLIIPPNSQVVLKQKVGSITTERPIIFLVNEEPKKAVLLGDGFWTWRLDEYRNYGETVRFDELITKLTQFLSAKPDKRQFKLYPAREDFQVGEEMLLIAETYNQLFEPIFGTPVSLNIYSDSTQWDYSFTPLAGSNKLSLDNLPEGLFSYSGTTYIDGKKHTVEGQFSVAKPNIEAADLTADHRTLRKLANDSGGKFFTLEELNALKQEMTSLEATSVIHSQESEILLFNLVWVYILLLLLATTEWLSRKMLGSY